MNNRDVRLAVDLRCDLGEGPVWVDDILYFVDINLGRLFRWDSRSLTTRDLKPRVGRLGAAVPTAGGLFILCAEQGLFRYDFAADAVEPIVHPEVGRETRFNDAKASPDGRLFAGTMHVKASGNHGSLYRLDAPATATPLVTDVGISNGLAWLADRKTFYYVDTPTVRVDAFDYDGATGDISGRRTVVSDFGGKGKPDGMTIDADGKLWVALYNGGAVVQVCPETDKVLQRVELPAPQTTSCCFGGPDLRTLYVTTASQGYGVADREQYPLAGAVFAVEVGVTGTPTDKVDWAS